MAQTPNDGDEYNRGMPGTQNGDRVSSDVDMQTANIRHASPLQTSNLQFSEALFRKTRCASQTASSTSNSAPASAAASAPSSKSRRNSVELTLSSEELAGKNDPPLNGLPASLRSASSSEGGDTSVTSEKGSKKRSLNTSIPFLSHPTANPRKRKRSDPEGTPPKKSQGDSTGTRNVCDDSKSPEAPAMGRQDGLTSIEEHDPNPILGVTRAQAFSFSGTPGGMTPCTDVDNMFDENGTASSSQLAKKAVKTERRLPGRKRQPNPDVNIEASLRRQLQLKTNYRAVAKALKPILAELARRSIEEIKKEAEACKRYEQYDTVLQQINMRLNERLAYLDETYWLKKKYAEKVSHVERLARREECTRAIRNLQEEHLLRCKCRLLRIERDAASDSDLTDDEDGPIPPVQGVIYPYNFTGPLSKEYDSRSRYFKEVGRLWQENEIRHRVKLNYVQQAPFDIGGEGNKDHIKIANSHIPGFATFDVAKHERATASFNVSVLAEAAQEIQEKTGTGEIELKLATSNTNALDILASASEIAASTEIPTGKKRKHLLDKADSAKKQPKTKSKKIEMKEDLKAPIKFTKQKTHIGGDELEPSSRATKNIRVAEKSRRQFAYSPKRVESPKLSKVGVIEKAIDYQMTEIKKPQASKITDLLNDDVPNDDRATKEAPPTIASKDDIRSISDWPWSNAESRSKDNLSTEADDPRYEPRELITKKAPKSPKAEDSQTRRKSFWSTVRRSSQNESSTSTAWPHEGHIHKGFQSSAYKADDGLYTSHQKPPTAVQQATVYAPPPLQQHYIPFQKPTYDEFPSREVRYQRSEAPSRANSYSAQQYDIHEQSLRDSWEEGRRRSRELMRYESAYNPPAAPHYTSSSSNYPVDDPRFHEPVRRDRFTYDSHSDTRDVRTVGRHQSGQVFSQHGSLESEARFPSFPVLHHRSSSYSQGTASAYGDNQGQSHFHDSISHRSQSVRPYNSSAASSPSYSTYPSYGQPHHHSQPEYQPSYQHYSYSSSSATGPAAAQILPPPQSLPQSQYKGYQGPQYGGQAILPANNESRQGYYNGPSSHATPQHSPAFSQLHSISSITPYSQGSEQTYRSGYGAPPQTATAHMPASTPTAAAVPGLGPKRRSRGRGSLPNPEFRRYFGPKQR